jgi:hypothetical protein
MEIKAKKATVWSLVCSRGGAANHTGIVVMEKMGLYSPIHSCLLPPLTRERRSRCFLQSQGDTDMEDRNQDLKLPSPHLLNQCNFPLLWFKAGL